MLTLTKLSFIDVHNKISAGLEEKCFFVCRAGLEEELDIMRVQAAKDRATVKELHLHLAKDHRGKPPHVFSVKNSVFKDIFFSLLNQLLWYWNIFWHYFIYLQMDFVFINICNRSIIITVGFNVSCLKWRACSCLTAPLHHRLTSAPCPLVSRINKTTLRGINKTSQLRLDQLFC